MLAMLAGVLACLLPRSLAVCRCVCREWRAAVDVRGLLLPRCSLHSIFINYNEHPHSHLLSRPQPAAGAAVDGTLAFMPYKSWRTLMDHCNGLFIYEDGNRYYVCNPATRRWARLPPRMEAWDYAEAYLVFDPAASLHYEVFLLPRTPGKTKHPHWPWQRRPSGVGVVETPETLVEWPPAVFKMDVFSFWTGRWEERELVRQGGAVATVSDVMSEDELPIRICLGPQRRYAEY